MAYMLCIIQASQEYEESAWAAYDAMFSRQAAATGLRDWAKFNSSLYTCTKVEKDHFDTLRI